MLILIVAASCKLSARQSVESPESPRAPAASTATPTAAATTQFTEHTTVCLLATEPTVCQHAGATLPTESGK